MTDDATDALPVRPLDYRRANDPQLPAVMGWWPQVWLGVGLWYAALLVTVGRGIFLPLLVRRSGSLGPLLVANLLAALPPLAATVWVLAGRVWDGLAVAVLLAVAWLPGSSLNRFGVDSIATVVRVVVTLGAACLYLVAATRYQGVAIGLAVGGLTTTVLVAILVATLA